MNAINRPPRLLSHWKREKPEKNKQRYQLSKVEQAHARNALRFVRAQYGSSEALAPVLGVSRSTVAQAAGNHGVSLDLAMKVARLAVVPITDVLTGAWPAPHKCPTCGQDWDR